MPPLSSVISAQSNVREQLVESYDSFKGELSETAEESTRLAGQLGAEIAKSSSNAVSSKKPSNQSRLTVLQRIGSLHGQQPVTGYDERNVQEIQNLLAEGDDKLSARVREYERPRKRRDGVLHAADAQLSKS